MEKEAKFAKGDAVKFKAGGPEMCIREPVLDPITETFNGEYGCQWFAGKQLQYGVFPEESLEKVPDSETKNH